MTNGFWTVTFSIPADAGHGVVTIRDGAVTGGDSSFTYIGSLADNGNGVVSGEIHVKRHSQILQSIMPGLDNYTLDVSGSVTNGAFSLSGTVRGNAQAKLTITGKKVANV